MIITADMPVEPGTTVEFSGRLLDMMDVEDSQQTGAKVGRDGDMVTFIAGAGGYPYKKLWLDPDDAEHLGRLLLEKAAETRACRGDTGHAGTCACGHPMDWHANRQCHAGGCPCDNPRVRQ